jgi:DNA-binding PadR family transcriptional regulator
MELHMSLPHILLGMLKLAGELSAYDLQQLIDESTGHFWYSDYSQVHRALASLEADGYVTGGEDDTTNRTRIPYSSTPQGDKAFLDWVQSDLQVDKSRRSDLAKLFFGYEIPPERLTEQVTAYRKTHEELLQRYQHIETALEQERKDNPREVPYWLITLEFGKRYTQMIIDWCDYILENTDVSTG